MPTKARKTEKRFRPVLYQIMPIVTSQEPGPPMMLTSTGHAAYTILIFLRTGLMIFSRPSIETYKNVFCYY